MRRAGSPVHVSSLPSTRYLTPASFSTDAIARATCWPRPSSAAVQPTHSSTSCSGSSLIANGVRALHPVGAGGLRAAPRVPALLHGRERVHRALRHVGLLHRQEAPHVHDGVDVLDERRARLHARPARRARPEHVGRDRTVHEVGFRRRRLGVRAQRQQHRRARLHVGLRVLDELPGRERLAAAPRGALVLAPPAVRAGVEVEQLLGRELRDLRCAEHLQRIEVSHRPERALGPRDGGAHHEVERADEDVHEWPEPPCRVDERRGHQPRVRPPQREVRDLHRVDREPDSRGCPLR